MSVNGSSQDPVFLPPSAPQIEGLSASIELNPDIQLTKEDEENLRLLAALNAGLMQELPEFEGLSASIELNPDVQLTKEDEEDPRILAALNAGLMKEWPEIVGLEIAAKKNASSIDINEYLKNLQESAAKNIKAAFLVTPDSEDPSLGVARPLPKNLNPRQLEHYLRNSNVAFEGQDQDVTLVGQAFKRLVIEDEHGNRRMVDPRRFRGVLSREQANILINAYVVNQTAIQALRDQQNEEKRRAQEAEGRANQRHLHQTASPRKNIEHLSDKEEAREVVKKAIAANKEAQALQNARKEGEIHSLIQNGHKTKKQIDKTRRLVNEAIDLTHAIKNEEVVLNAQKMLDKAARSVAQEHDLVPVQSKQVLPGGAVRLTVFNKALGKAILQARNIYIADKHSTADEMSPRSPDKHVFRHIYGNVHFARPITRGGPRQ